VGGGALIVVVNETVEDRIMQAIKRDREARLALVDVLPPAAPVTDGGDQSALRRAECGQYELRAYREEMRHKLQQLPLPGLPARVEHLLEEEDCR
jgi:hypothetical protein